MGGQEDWCSRCGYRTCDGQHDEISKENYEQASDRYIAAVNAVDAAETALKIAKDEEYAAELALRAQESRPGIAAYLNAGAK